MNQQTELELAQRATAGAGAFLAEAFTRKKRVLSQEGRDIKLQADKDAERIILDTLAVSPHPVLAEESGEHGGVDPAGPHWVVDPLDGTMNFNQGIPFCCTSIAFCDGPRPVLGVIVDFVRGETFRGVAGEGAWLNDAPMRVSDATDPARSVLATGFPTSRQFDSDTLKDFIRAAQTYKKIRMLGSAALMLAYVACGRVDAYGEDDIMWWDVAAGLALVEAAGGYVDCADSGVTKWARRVRCAASRGVLG